MPVRRISYFITPLIPNLIPGLFRLYTVSDDQKLHVRGIFTEIATIPLEEVASRVTRGPHPLGAIQNFVTGSGNLSLTGSTVGPEGVTIRNLYLVSDFKKAVDGIHPDVQPPIPAEPEVPEAPWHEGLELSNKVVTVPMPSEFIMERLRARSGRIKYFNQRPCGVGAIVHQGQRIATFGKPTESAFWNHTSAGILAPAEGKIIDSDSQKIKIQITERAIDWTVWDGITVYTEIYQMIARGSGQEEKISRALKGNFEIEAIDTSDLAPSPQS